MATAVQGAGIEGIIEQIPTYDLCDPLRSTDHPSGEPQGRLDRIEDHSGIRFPGAKADADPGRLRRELRTGFYSVMQYQQLSRDELIGLHCNRPYLFT